MASAAQPQSVKIVQGKTNFGGTVVDGNRNNLVGMGSWFQTQDATPTTALISPLTVTTGTVVNLVVPPNAYSVTFLTATNGVAISEVLGTTSLTQAFNLPAGIPITVDITRQNNIYLLGISGSATVSFMFSTI